MKKQLLVFFLILFINLAFGQNYNSLKHRVDSLLSEFIKIAGIPGLSVAVAVNNKIIYSNSFGLAYIDKKIPVNDSTKFRIGSVTKLFTATATVKLIEKGIIDPDTRVTKYIKSLPPPYRDITIAQLASHTAGIRHYTRSEIMSKNATEYSDLEDGLYKFINDSLLSKPGEKYSYSSYGYILLGAALENACNKKFNDIINEYIIRPSGMTNTFPDLIDRSYSNISHFYYLARDNEFVKAQGENYSYKWPAGGYLSTAGNLVKFGSELMSGKIVDNKMLSLLFNSQKTNDGKETNVGYGFRIATDDEGRKVVHHGGESEGARAFILMYPEQKLAIAFLANVYRAPIFEGEAETIAGFFLNDYNFKKNLLSGIIHFSTTYNKKEVSGEINIDDNKIIGLTKTEMPITDIVEEENKIRIISLSSSGIINIWLTKKKGKFEGKWGYDKESTGLTFH